MNVYGTAGVPDLLMVHMVLVCGNLFFLISDINILSKKKNNTAQYIGNVLKGQKHQENKLQ